MLNRNQNIVYDKLVLTFLLLYPEGQNKKEDEKLNKLLCEVKHSAGTSQR